MTTHAESKAREYQAWWRMKQNCQNKNYPGYRTHGMKGIQLCAEWNDFINFMRDMGAMPENCNALIRLEKTIDFCKMNCKWGYVNQGRPRKEVVKKSKTARGKLANPKVLCFSIEQDHYDFISSQALKMSQEKGVIVQVNDLIREALKKQFPAPKLFDMFGGEK